VHPPVERQGAEIELQRGQPATLRDLIKGEPTVARPIAASRRFEDLAALMNHLDRQGKASTRGRALERVRRLGGA
jgi:hypothetical protein